MLLHQTNGIGGRDEFGVIFIEDSLHGGIEEMDRLGQLVGEFEEGIGEGGFDEEGCVHRGGKVDRVEIDGCLLFLWFWNYERG